MSHAFDDDPYYPPRAPVGTFPGPKSGSGGGGKRPKAEHIEGSPWLTVWTRPRSTIRTIVDTDPTRNFLLLATCYGASNALSQLSNKPTTLAMSTAWILGIVAISGFIGGVIGLYFSAWLFEKTGRWLGGRADREDLRAALAWGSVPGVPLLALNVGLILAFGLPALQASRPILVVSGVCAVVLGLWAVFTSVKCIAEVQRFSSLKALGSSLLAILVILGVVAVFAIFLVLARVALISA